MTEIKKETVTTQGDDINSVVNARTEKKATTSQTIEYLVYFLFGALEILLAFRLVLKLTGASIGSAFVGLIYGITGIFTLPFEGIFHKAIGQGVETVAVFEPATFVAILVYAVIGWGIVKLVRILSGDKQAN
ncbi:MAG: YggT family protein [Candidatus Moranbacteria bacterium]|nr:YggT family protein [Candidatus Moranbacteria bacterium]